MTELRGPRVFLDYDQAALDAAYDQAVYAPNRDLVHRRGAAQADAARLRLPAPLTFAYGDGPAETIELFCSERRPAPIFYFVHGGAWRTNSAKRYASIAESLLDAGVDCALVEFDGVETVGGRLEVLADQVRRGFMRVLANAPAFGGDPERAFVGGHSSGAHLAATLLATDWTAHGLPADAIKGGVCCSGMYELAPVALSHRSSYVRFTDATIEALSPIRHLDRIAMPVVLAYGTEETPEFQRQGREFAAALRRAGKEVELLVGDGYNHFEIAETFGNPYGLLGAAVRRLVTGGRDGAKRRP